MIFPFHEFDFYLTVIKINVRTSNNKKWRHSNIQRCANCSVNPLLYRVIDQGLEETPIGKSCWDYFAFVLS